jgi:hypothetical protein
MYILRTPRATFKAREAASLHSMFVFRSSFVVRGDTERFTSIVSSALVRVSVCSRL